MIVYADNEDREITSHNKTKKDGDKQLIIMGKKYDARASYCFRDES